MAEKEGYTHNFYAGADYGLDPKYGQEFAIKMDKGYNFSAGSFGLTTDPRSVNHLGAVSNKLNTGAKVIEVTAIQTQILESIPNQHLDEVNRLRKLTGVDLTFHGPILEPSGFPRQGSWNEGQREQVEKQMWSAVQRSNRIDPKGNVVVTFHSGAVGVNPETRVFTEVVDPTTGKKEKKEVIKEVFVIDEGSGQAGRIEMTPNYFLGTDKKKIGDLNEQRRIIDEKMNERNKETWAKQLQGIAYHAFQGKGIIQGVLANAYGKGEDGEVKDVPKEVFELYKMYTKG